MTATFPMYKIPKAAAHSPPNVEGLSQLEVRLIFITFEIIRTKRTLVLLESAKHRLRRRKAERDGHEISRTGWQHHCTLCYCANIILTPTTLRSSAKTKAHGEEERTREATSGCGREGEKTTRTTPPSGSALGERTGSGCERGRTRRRSRASG